VFTFISALHSLESNYFDSLLYALFLRYHVYKQMLKIEQKRLDMVVQDCNPSTQELRQEKSKFKATLGYIVSSR
jgi:hypothetical protein